MRTTPISVTNTTKSSGLIPSIFLLLLIAVALLITGVQAATAVQPSNSTASDLIVSKSANTSQPLPDQLVTFSIQIVNSGVVSATNGTLSDNLDHNLTFVGPVNIEGGGDTAAAGTPPNIASGLTISPSDRVTVTFSVRVNSALAAGTAIKNTAVADSSETTEASSNEITLTVAAAPEVKWKQRSAGIFGGRVNALAGDRQNAAVLYAGTEVGLFKSSDGGGSWAAANTGLDNHHVESLALDPLHSDVLYAGTQGGIFKSSDGAGSWTSANSGLGGSTVSSLAIDPGNPAILYAGTEAGVFKSSDGGDNWTAANEGLNNLNITALAIDPRHSVTLFAGTQGGGVFKSSNGGGSWTPANSGLADLDIHVLGIDPTNSSRLYAGTGAGLYKSANSGQNWAAGGSELAGLDVLSLAIDPASSERLFAGTESGIFKSTNSGSSWAAAGSELSESAVPALVFNQANRQILYAGTAEQGVWQSSDSGAGWNWASDGLTGTKVRALAVDAVNKNLILAGTAGSGVFKSSDGGGHWEAVNSGLINRDVYALTIDPSNNDMLYTGTGGGVFKSDNAGESWTAMNSGLTNLTVRTLGIHSNNSQIVYAGTAGGGVFKSSNGGSSWSAANSGLADLEILSLAVDPTDGNVLYAGTEAGGVFKSSNSGGSWVAINNGLTITAVPAILIDPNNQIIYAGGTGGVFKSVDGGGSWAASSEGLDDVAVQALAFDPANSGILYAATAENGIYRSTGSGFNWTAVNDGLAEMNVQALVLASSNTLYAGTAGSGVQFSGPSLAVAKQVDKLDPLPGEKLVYTVLISNTGTLPISSATVNDNLNQNLIFVGPITIEGGGTAAKTGLPPQIASDLAIEPGNTATVTFTAQAKGGLANGTEVSNTAVVNAPQLHSSVSAQATTTVYKSNKLVISKTVDDPTPLAGQIINFTIEINNTAPHGVGAIDVMDTLDSHLTFIGPVAIIGGSGSSAKPGSPPLIASGLGVNSGQKVFVKFPAMVNVNTLPGTVIDNTAYVTSYDWPVPISGETSLTVSDPGARQIYVDTAATAGANDGSSWEDAYTSLQDALLNGGSGSEIWVAAGIYYPDVGTGQTADDPAATFHLRSGVAVYGGFAATENSLDERDPAANVTVLSGDIDGNDTAECGSAAGAIIGTNSAHVVTGSGMTNSAILDGFTISGGDAGGTAAVQNGGGMLNQSGSPTLANLIFCGNRADGSGGGMHNSQGSSPTLDNVTFQENEAHDGGGMSNDAASPALNDVIFSGNRAYYGGGIFNSNSAININEATFDANLAVWGGGIFNSDGSDGALSNITFTGNEASSGGGLSNDSSSPTLTNVTFAANVAGQSGGGMSTSGGDVSQSEIALINAVFSGNLVEVQANGQQSWGGGLFVSGGEAALANNTLSGNRAAAQGNRAGDEGLGGGLFVAAGTVTINNSILWGNEGDRSPDILVEAGGAAHISSSRLDGCPQYSFCDNLASDDPQFAAPVNPLNAPTTGGNLSLKPGSPLVDAGDNSLIPAGVLTDRAGEARIYNDIVDMGAFELPIACPASDVTRLYVDGSTAGGDNSGLDWSNALRQLSHAFALAEGCQDSSIGEIWVAAGKYAPTDGASGGARETSFSLQNGLAVYGGFDGSELVLEERDWLANQTILSGDIAGNDLVDANGIVTDTAKIVGSNSYHVVMSMGNDASAVLDGFIINGGQANGDAAIGHDSGGGIYSEAGRPTLSNLTILSNMADDGGGMANISGSSPLLTNVTIQDNHALYFGGGVYNQSSSPTLVNIALLDNKATSGGGMFNAISQPSLTNATFAGNQAVQQLTVNKQQITNNAGDRLRALGGTAGAVGSGGGMVNLNDSRPLITNSIFWQNEDDQGIGTASATIRNDAGSIPLIGHSLVQASGGSGSSWNGSMGVDQGDNIDVDPLFVAADNRRLQIGSQAIDVGDNSANSSELDLDGRQRVSDGTNDGEAVIDLGAYETPLMAITVSVTADVKVAKVGDTVTFTYVVTNDGTVRLNDIKASDDRFGDIPLDDTSLEAGETTGGTLAYTLLETDLGTLVTTVTVTGKSDAGAEVTAEDTVAIEVTPRIYRSFLPVVAKSFAAVLTAVSP